MSLRIRAGVTSLGVDAGEEVEIEDTPAVRKLLKNGFWKELRLVNGNRSSLSERD